MPSGARTGVSTSRSLSGCVATAGPGSPTTCSSNTTSSTKIWTSTSPTPFPTPTPTCNLLWTRSGPTLWSLLPLSANLSAAWTYPCSRSQSSSPPPRPASSSQPGYTLVRPTPPTCCRESSELCSRTPKWLPGCWPAVISMWCP